MDYINIDRATASILDNLECMLVYLASTYFFTLARNMRRYTSFARRERERERGTKARTWPAGSLVVRFIRAKYLSQVVVGIKRRANIVDTPRKKTSLVYQVQTRHRSVCLPRIIPRSKLLFKQLG